MAIFDVNNFNAVPYDGGILLSWTAGYGASTVSGSIDCKVTIQYSTDTIPNNVQNNPPYVTRDLGQKQGTQNVLWHPNLTNGQNYWYSLWIYYYDTGFWHGPYVTSSTPISGSFLPWQSGSISFSKLGTNTKLSPLGKKIVSDIIVWLPESEKERQPVIERALKKVAPAHVQMNVMYERYYIAHTTSAHFSGSAYASNVWQVTRGKITNKLPTIDSSYSGQANIKS